MNAAELMIKDLVKTNKGEVIKVESISTKRQHRKVGYHTDESFTKIKYVRQGQIEPILLTPEILEANGFVSRADAGYQRREDELANRHLTYYENSGMLGVGLPFVDRSSDIIHRIKYVHELQQALRLCGLKELADNFKIE